jgi:hypothetical protein
MLAECINSILAQSRPVQQIIVVNDGSTDNTIELVQSYGDRLVLLNKANAGKSSALNLALKHCECDYIWICDDDDLAVPDGVEQLADVLDRDHGVGFAFGTYQIFYHNGLNYSHSKPTESGLDDEPNVCLRFLEEMFTYQYAMLVRRSIYEQVGPFREDLIRAQDYEMAIRLARSCQGAWVPKTIFYQRYHHGVRGTSLEVILPQDEIKTQFTYDQKVFSWVKEQFHLDEFLPTFALTWQEAAAKRAALLERGCIFGAHAMWDEAIDNFRLAGGLTSTPATPEEVKLAKRVLANDHAWILLFDNPTSCKNFRSCYKSNEYCRSILGASCHRCVHRLLYLLVAGRYWQTLILIRKLCRILGIQRGLAESCGEILKAALRRLRRHYPFW